MVTYKFKSAFTPLNKSQAVAFAESVNPIVAEYRLAAKALRAEFETIEVGRVKAKAEIKRALSRDGQESYDKRELDEFYKRIDRMHEQKKADARKENGKTRLELLQRLRDLSKIASDAEFVLSPQAMLTAEAIGSPRRAQIFAEAQAMGPASLRALADRAVATNDREMAAAIGSVVSAMKVEDRPFEVADMADTLFGEESRAAIGALMNVHRLLLETENDNAKLESRESTSDEIRLGLLQQRIDQFTGVEAERKARSNEALGDRVRQRMTVAG